MFDTVKFGGYLARLRKRADMTQSEVADRLNVTRQAVSKYEVGDSFPDISILAEIAALFGVTADDLIAAGDPTAGESKVLTDLAKGLESEADSMDDVVNLAPFLRPSELEKISAKLRPQGVDMTEIVELSRYLSDSSTAEMLRNIRFDSVDGAEEMEFISHIMPLLDDESRFTLFTRVINGELNWRVLKILAPYTAHLLSHVEAAYMEGAIPKEAMKWYWHAVGEEVEKALRKQREP